MSGADPRLPAYGERSLADVLPAVARALGHGPGVVGAPPSAWELPDGSAYVVLLVDGLGAELLRRHAYAAPFLAELLERDGHGTAGVPSTTAASLTSFGTGLLPGTHGVVGYTTRDPATGRLLNALRWDDRVDPLLWQPHATAFERLAAAGTAVTSVGKGEFAGSGLTRAANRGARAVAAEDLEERVAAVVAAVGEAGRQPSVTYAYAPELDKTGHQHGVASGRWLAALGEADEEAERLRESLPPDVRLVVVADHGMVDVDPALRTDVDTTPVLREGVELLGGEARFRHLYCRPGAVEDVRATWTEVLGEDAWVRTRAEAVAEGWFGPLAATVEPRVGDVVVASRGRAAVMASRQFAVEMGLVGMHGSLTGEEMHIPLLVD